MGLRWQLYVPKIWDFMKQHQVKFMQNIMCSLMQLCIVSNGVCVANHMTSLTQKQDKKFALKPLVRNQEMRLYDERMRMQKRAQLSQLSIESTKDQNTQWRALS